MKSLQARDKAPSIPWVLLFALIGVLMQPTGGRGQEIEQYFKTNCANCHSLGGVRKVGPDLKDVTKRRDRDWLVRFMQNPLAAKESGDADAVKLFADYPGSVMPTLPDLSAERCESILRLIEAESKLEHSQFAGAESKIPNRPFTAQEIDKGHEFFVGHARFAKGGTPCLACHSVQGVSATGGGMLGPDLTHAFAKLGGRTGLNGWLSSPPTATMKPIYRNHPLSDDEIVALIAYLEKATEGREEPTTARFNFFLIGLGGTAGALVTFDYLWRRRFRTVRRTLVHGDH
jgi:cytochrome c2